jgi:hypothetical protein
MAADILLGLSIALISFLVLLIIFIAFTYLLLSMFRDPAGKVIAKKLKK